MFLHPFRNPDKLVGQLEKQAIDGRYGLIFLPQLWYLNGKRVDNRLDADAGKSGT